MQCIAPWLPAFKTGLTKEDEPFVLFLFLTVDPSTLAPHVRTCVFRGFLFDDELTNLLVFTTDRRLSKIEQLLANPAFEACFYFRKTGKQFRLSGKAAVLMPAHGVYPEIELPDLDVDPVEEEEDDEEDEDGHGADPGPSGRVLLHRSASSAVFSVPRNPTIASYPVFSPGLLLQLQKEHEAHPHVNLADMLRGRPELVYAPTKDDYAGEFERVWATLLLRSKSAFKRPRPKSSMTEDRRKQMDRIARGVDGKSVEDGRGECAVVVMLVDRVDYYRDSYGDPRRLVYERVNWDQWKETEVVP